ncbi:ABC transporter permease [Georgenia yuyongxinii]|uniref:ABC transporter permease subunit n=1 Tax=Georgenia yuyongxinii TaxID=2589797 RepID=A0A552WR97_9MICO|nr:ABC transporter permease subunit [Georgenia yuyongxinii]
MSTPSARAARSAPDGLVPDVAAAVSAEPGVPGATPVPGGSQSPGRWRWAGGPWPRWVRPAVLGIAGVLMLALVWELYKLLGPVEGVSVGETRVLPRTDERSMPHVWEMVSRLFQPATGAPGAPPLLVPLLSASVFTLGVAMLGWFVGVVVGAALAVLMLRWRLAESAVLPWVILSQTVPLVALAPLVVGWGGRIHIGSLEWERWMSVAAISAYLSFFMVAVGTLRGLKAPDAVHVDLFRSYAVGWWRTLVRLRLPAAVPFLLPALRLAAATAIVGAIVAEVSTGTAGGIGRLIISYAQSASGDPAKPWTAIFAAAALGLVAAGLVSLVGTGLRRYRFSEVS